MVAFFLKITPAPQIVVTNPAATITLNENGQRPHLYFQVEDSLALYGTNLTVTATSADNTALLPVGTADFTPNKQHLPVALEPDGSMPRARQM